MISEVKRDKSAKLKENDLSPLPYFDWDKAKYFYYVARLKSFNQAGQFLKISQSGLSRKVQTLESHIGFRVFNRNQKGVELTRKGEQLFDIVESTFLNLKKLSFDPIVKIDDGQKRLIRIATTNAIAAYVLSDIIIDYNEKYPEILFEFITDDHLIDITINDVDIVIRPFDSYTKGIQQELLFSLQKGLYASQKYLDKYGEPKSVEDLKNHHIISPSRPKDYPYSNLDWILHLGLNGSKNHIPKLTSSSLEVSVKAAEKGVGIIAGHGIMDIIRNSNLKEILSTTKTDKTQWFFIYPDYLSKDTDILNLKSYLDIHLSKFI